MNHVLECRNIHKHFGGLNALANINLGVSQGEILGIIGPNGAGKTTLFNIMSGALRPSAGEIYFKEKNITKLGPHRICRLGIARTYQLVRPFASLTSLENVMVGLCFGRTAPCPSGKRVQEALELLNLVGLTAKANEAAENLTLVDKKHLEIARALATDPEVLLLDEVVSGLTSSETSYLINTILEIAKRGITIILIEHVLRVVMELCHRVMVLHYGVQIAHGSPLEVINNEHVIEAYLGNAAQDEGGLSA
jgi:branched-chain amino acid transport system ATP-binding protein